MERVYGERSPSKTCYRLISLNIINFRIHHSESAPQSPESHHGYPDTTDNGLRVGIGIERKKSRTSRKTQVINLWEIGLQGITDNCGPCYDHQF